MKEEEGKKTSPVVTDAVVKEVIPAKPAELSDKDLDKVAGGVQQPIADWMLLQRANQIPDPNRMK